MTKDWSIKKIKEFCVFKYGKNLPADKRIDGPYPVYGSSSIASYHEDYLIEAPGLIIGRKGTVGKVQLSKENYFPIDTTFYVDKTCTKENIYFLYYFFQLCGFEGMNSDAAVPGLNRNAAVNLKVSLPQRVLQNKIATVLLTYDDLIENNLKRIKLLEEMAQITYEEWFVRMKFPGHETAVFDAETDLPEGWTTKNLGHFIEHEIGGGWGEEEASKEFSESAYVIRGTDFDSLPTGKTQNVPLRWHKKSNLASRKLAPGDIIFEVSGGSQNEGVAKTALMTEEFLSLFNEGVMCASFCKLARPTSMEVGHYLFYFLRFLRKIKASEVFEIRSASNIVNYNWTAFLKFQEVNLPSESLLDEFHALSENSTKQISVLAKQVKLLKEARDILLPRLMTGMIDIEKVELPEAMLRRLEEQEDKMATAV
ncbi:restriction endonuclease subunit S [Pseudoalteromonas sp. SR43-6]|uniref:restriction endonuclease subunit S n=1 Tax=unclassified Pseudoalteromonas TaxID=194690 RepID=UPI0015FDA2BA|nr:MULTISPECIES: restriction endonuclease subunit S [unclassified Pseudoalteromonas]MBB1288583.1 restriction endonuclease subunit S [Pseudoalteromonas sp. SR41-5]MBB1373993.1 restriction endonuclease subunit S [Pseudoalteromonas sp. SR43-6]MBB1413044.1 restriction endonuclease subunit S [Pseudoalteromonas sp. SG43-8]